MELLKSPDTILNAAYLLSYFSTPEDALKVDIESERAKNFEMRNILKQYREIENMKKIANRLYDFDEQIQNFLKNPSSGKIPSLANVKVSFYIVYFGTLHLGQYIHHIKNLQFFSKINPVYSCIIFELVNKFFINLRQPFHSDIYKNTLIDELHKRGVESAKIEI